MDSVTKSDLEVIETKLDAMNNLLENELRHLRESVRGLKHWRDAFVAEDGPWRGMDRRVEKLERLAVGVRWLAGVLSPVAIWAVIEIVESVVLKLR